MKYLLKLARFVSNKEQVELIREISSLLLNNSTKDNQSKVTADTWAPKNRIQISCNSPLKNDLLENISSKIGVWQVIAINTEKEYLSIKDTIKELLDLVSEKKSFSLDIQIFKGAKFHKRAFHERWIKKQKDPIIVDVTETKYNYYLEVKAKKYRIGQIRKQSSSLDKRIENKIPTFLIIQNPHSKLEIADFIRIGIMFSIPIYINCESQNLKTVNDLLLGAKKIIKGWNKTKIFVIESLSEIIDSNDIIAFSMWSKRGERELKEYISALNNEYLIKKRNKLGLLFGNEMSGLTYEARKLIHPNIFHLGPSSSEPLRASQAASYVLGLIACTLLD